MGGPRILLVEFLNRDRFCQYRSEPFPFVAGYARRHDHALRWLAFGFDPQRLPNGPFRMTLSADEEALLLRAVAEHHPTHVLLNEELDAPLDATLRAAAAPARVDVHTLAGGPALDRLLHLEVWLGTAPPEAAARIHESPLLVDAADPDYASELAPSATTIHPFVPIVGGPACLYHYPLARNPAFAGLDLAGAHRQVGCSFCGESGDHRYPCTTPPVALALKQLRAARATCPPQRSPGEYVLWGAAMFMRIHDILAAVLDEGFPPSAFFVSCRADELLRKAHHLERLLPRLAAAGHSLNVYNMGAENFAPAENERLNKGLTVAALEAAFDRMAAWERDFPSAFRFGAHGGFGFIVFTPWTTLDDLRFNLRMAERFRVREGNFLFFVTSRLRCLPGRPITLLAARDGLLAEAFPDPAVGGFGDSGAIVAGDQRELPWRFRDPVVGALYSVLIRLAEHGAVPADDELAAFLAALRAALPEALREPQRFADQLVATAADGDATTPRALLERLAAVHGVTVVASADHAARRDTLERALRVVVRALAEHPKQLLRGFQPRSVVARAESRGWGALEIELGRGAERLRVHLRARDPSLHALVTTEHFAATYDPAAPADTEEKRALVALLARALERYAGKEASHP